MKQLRQTKAARDPKSYDKRADPFASIKIVILRSVNQVESSDPANYTGREHQRRKIDTCSLRDPCTNRSDGQRQSEKKVRCAREPLGNGVEKNCRQSDRREQKRQLINCRGGTNEPRRAHNQEDLRDGF